MNIPKFWAEARRQQRQKGKQVTVRRFGWSRTSQAEAQANAEARTADAFQRILAGEDLWRREFKQAYNGAEGVPIREEIVAEHGDLVITRNSYGALCLNTERVLFADVDFDTELDSRLGLVIGLAMLIPAAWLSWRTGTGVLFFPLAVLGFALPQLGHWLLRRARGGEEKIARNRLANFIAMRPGWRLRVYRTPAGLRVLATHRPFSAEEPEVAELFRALGADPVYVTMCQRQKCFRARVSPKPWRIGITAHMKPRRGVWPVRPESLPARKAWVDAYHAKAAGFAACRFERELGNGGVDATVRRVIELHDELCRATSGLPIA
jgi:hypothetical protein